MPGRRSRFANSGYTLMEALIASAILATMVVGIGGMLASAHQQDSFSNEQSAAMALARSAMEDMAALPFEPTSSGSTRSMRTWPDTTDRVRADGTTVATTSTEAGTFARTVTVRRYAQPGGSENTAGNFARVTVTITTPAGRLVTLNRMVAKGL